MKTAAIICELNPAHKGHKYIFDKTREITGCDYIIAIMSGDYVQRGEPAIYNKHVRSSMALECGADLVLELPGLYATASARYFAEGATAIANALGIVNYLAFGSETADITLITDEDNHNPNDVLAREYLNAIKSYNYSLQPIIIKREGSDYNNINIDTSMPSASALRQQILDGNDVAMYIPGFSEIGENDNPVFFDDFSKVLFGKLIHSNPSELNYYFDIYEDLAHKIYGNINQFTSISSFCDLLKSKDIAYAHIKRALVHILLNYTKEDINTFSKEHLIYLRVLAFKREAKPLLTSISANCQMPLVTKLADAHKILSAESYKMLEKDIQASHLYSHIANTSIINEYTRQIKME